MVATLTLFSDCRAFTEFSPEIAQPPQYGSFKFIYRLFIKYCVFYLKFVIFLNSVGSASALVFYLPGVCTHTDTEGTQREARVRNILKSSEKKHNI